NGMMGFTASALREGRPGLPREREMHLPQLDPGAQPTCTLFRSFRLPDSRWEAGHEALKGRLVVHAVWSLRPPDRTGSYLPGSLPLRSPRLDWRTGLAYPGADEVRRARRWTRRSGWNARTRSRCWGSCAARRVGGVCSLGAVTARMP